MPIIFSKDGDEKIVPWSQYHKRFIKTHTLKKSYKKPRKKFIPRGCEMDSPMYVQILKEISKGYTIEPCIKTYKILITKIK